MTDCNSKNSSDSCRPISKSELQTYEQVVQGYIDNWRERSAGELKDFQTQPSVEKAIEYAGLAQTPDGKRFDHQRRIRPAALHQATASLMNARAELQTCQNFDELIQLVHDTIGPIQNIGPLTIYDTALRLGAFLGLEPTKVYLHAGTKEGAKALGLDNRSRCLPVSIFPNAFRRLRPREIEDCLCLYEPALRKITSAEGGTR
jgi:hypothetical protein